MVMGPAWDRAKAHHMGCILRRKLPAVVATVCLLITLPGIAMAHSNRATLIEVHVLEVSHDRATGTANCSNQPNNPGNGGFVLTGWQVQANVAASLNAATIPTNLNGNAVRTQLTNSFAAWKQAEAMAPGITVTGSTAITKATANHSYDLLFGRTSASAIAVTSTWQWPNGDIESDTVFNKKLKWFIAGSEGDGCLETKPRYDLANIATHEFGHTYGLGHPNGGRWETMYAFGFTGETLKRSLGAGDTAGIRAIY